MSSRLLSRVLAAVLLAGAILGGRLALANAASLQDVLAQQLVPSATPALLAPIASVGRKGWNCRPEQAAAAAQWHAAELPSGPEQR